jgi:hypothetical protein
MAYLRIAAARRGISTTTPSRARATVRRLATPILFSKQIAFSCFQIQIIQVGQEETGIRPKMVTAIITQDDAGTFKGIESAWMDIRHPWQLIPAIATPCDVRPDTAGLAKDLYPQA